MRLSKSRDNKEALVRVCREFTVLCSELNLYSAELVAIDGSKFYICPGKQELTYRFDSFKKNRHIRYYAASNCNNYSTDNKRITRWIHEDVNERMREHVRKWPNIMTRAINIVGVKRLIEAVS